MRLEENNLTEAVEREQCIEVLKAMLTVVDWERIIPREVLTHLFITKDYPKCSSTRFKRKFAYSFRLHDNNRIILCVCVCVCVCVCDFIF